MAHTLSVGTPILISAIALLLGSCGGSRDPVPPQSIVLAVPEAPSAAALPSISLQPTAVPVQTANPPGLLARLNWQGELGERTIVFNTPEETVKLRQVGFGSLILKMGETVVHVNPWSEAADYSTLPKADQIWITDPLPEHLDVHAIRQISKDSTQLIVDSASARYLEGLLSFVPLGSDAPITVDGIGVQAVPAYWAEMLPDGPRLHVGNSYLASFGDFRLFLAGEAHFIPNIAGIGKVDVALLTLDTQSSLSPEQAAEIARSLQPTILLPYQYQGQEPAVLGQLLVGTGTMVLPLNASEGTTPRAGGPTPDRSVAITEIYLEGQEPDPALLDALFGTEQDAPALLLPDLRTLAPSELRVTHSSSDGSTLLKLDNSIWNGGYGPLDLIGAPDLGSGSQYVVQRILRDDGEYDERSVGEFIFHTEHNHWHLDSFSVYELWSLQPDGTLDQVVATSGKVSFFLRDIRRSPLAERVDRAGFTSCSPARQGLSVGWTDIYEYYLAGQSIDISGLKDGTYALMSTADPYNLIRESDETNNGVVIRLEIQGTKVTVIDQS
ncbi:MAG: lysyl oxidase family protein [Anaerolineales bacterium]